jgi:hypothetical protein
VGSQNLLTLTNVEQYWTPAGTCMQRAYNLPDQTAVDSARAVGKNGSLRRQSQWVPFAHEICWSIERRQRRSDARPRTPASRRGRELATQLRASYIDDEGRRAGHWRLLSRPVKAYFRLAVDSACPYRALPPGGPRIE